MSLSCVAIRKDSVVLYNIIVFMSLSCVAIRKDSVVLFNIIGLHVVVLCCY